ncbi:MAG: GNAT family N-acetyltransferase [Luteibaculum sp.]
MLDNLEAVIGSGAIPKLLDWDSNFFGFPIASIQLESIKQQIDPEKLSSQHLLYLESTFQATSYIIPGYSCSYQGSKMTFQAAPKKSSLPCNAILGLELEAKNQKELLELSLTAGKYSRFNCDPNFSVNQFQALYTRWIKESLLGNLAEEIFVVRDANRIVGFATVKIEGGIASVGLIAVHQEYRKQGIARSLLDSVRDFAFHRGLSSVFITTQGENLLAQESFFKAGFTFSAQRFIQHYWKI